MRVSADPEDRDYSPIADRLQVRLNGVPVPTCISADEERGEVLMYDVDSRGWMCISKSYWYGCVEILVDPRAAPAERVLGAKELVEKYRVKD